MKILYLYAEVMGYTVATFRALTERGAELHIVHWDHRKLTQYQPPECPGVTYYRRSEMGKESMVKLAADLSPDLTVVSGWMDKDYTVVARRLRIQGSIVVVGLDGQWHGSWRQYAAALLGGLGYFSRFYTHAWVSGPYQYEWARRLGFDKKNIVYDLYSADLDLFHESYRRRRRLENERHAFSHRFLFVGRFESIKGIDALLRAWQALGDNRHDWELHLVGNGTLKDRLSATQGITVKDFMQPERLIEEVNKAGCFVLPSRGEPWGVVVHEFAAAGIPLIISDVVGAASTFLISGLNGYSFKANDSKSLENRMRQITESPDERLIAMAAASHELSHRISPASSAGNLLSLLEY